SANRASTASTQAEPSPANGGNNAPGIPPSPPGTWPNPPGTPGPDDNYLVSFPQSNATWSDIALIFTDISNTNNGSRSPVLYAALGTSSGDGTHSLANGVYWTESPRSNNVIWYAGDPGGSPFSNPAVQPAAGTVDSRNGGFPVVGAFPIPFPGPVPPKDLY